VSDNKKNEHTPGRTWQAIWIDLIQRASNEWASRFR